MDYHSKYENNIFISYTRTDNDEPDAKGWVTVFYEHLRHFFLRYYGRNRQDPGIWIDFQNRENVDIKETTFHNLNNSFILVPLISPSYINSDWCIEELSSFWEKLEKEDGANPQRRLRLFKVLAFPLEEEDEELFAQRIRKELHETLRNKTGYQFYEIDQTTEKTFLYELDSKYREQFRQLIMDLAKHASRLLKSAHVHSADDTEADNVPTKGKIYLASTTTDLKWQYDQLKREMRERGYTVLPENENLPDNLTDLESAVRQYLDGCLLSVHLVGSKRGMVPEGAADRSVVELQLAMAEACLAADKPKLVWLPANLSLPEGQQKNFLDNLDYQLQSPGSARLECALEDLKTIIMDKLNHY